MLKVDHNDTVVDFNLVSAGWVMIIYGNSTSENSIDVVFGGNIV